MKVRYSYRKYPYSIAASDWSERKSKILLFTLPITAGFAAFFHALMRELQLLDEDISWIIGFIIPIVFLVCFVIYCGKQEKFHAACGMFAQKFQRPPTEEEKKRIREILKRKRPRSNVESTKK